jgi:fumarylacetoacetate (FAA) hydrolase
MKFATLNDGSRDGVLLIVSRDNKRAVKADDIAPTLQAALDAWDDVVGALQARSDELNAGDVEGQFDVDTTKLHSPLPRAYQWLDGSAYLNHVQLVRKARGAEMPPSYFDDPLMYQGQSECFLAPNQDIAHKTTEWGIDFEGEIAVVTGDVPYHTSEADAAQHIRLIMLVNDVSLRGLIPSELAKGFGFVVSKPPTAFSPFALTPDELGDAWQGGKVCLPLEVTYNGEWFGNPEAGEEMQFSFPRLVSHASQTRPLGAGTIIGSGTVSNKDRAKGSSCLAEKRMIEKIETGEFKTPFMNFGDTIRIEMHKDGESLFGAIEQKVVKWEA